MKQINEDTGSGVTQVSNVAPGQKIDVFGNNNVKDIDELYEEFNNLQDCCDCVICVDTVDNIISLLDTIVTNDMCSDYDKLMCYDLIDELLCVTDVDSVTLMKGLDGNIYFTK